MQRKVDAVADAPPGTAHQTVYPPRRHEHPAQLVAVGNAEASMTVGTPTAITGTPRFSADSISLLLPTPEPGAMPLLHT